MSKTISTLRSSEVILAEATGEINPQVQILRTGKFNHPVYGPFEITPQILAEMKANFDSKVRGIDIAFDYFHDNDKIAAGWPKELELRNNGSELWAGNVEWTPRARQMLSDKELRYFSPEFMLEWTDPESGQSYTNVLFGGGLTNRPFVKEMEPLVSLSEKEKQELLQSLKNIERKLADAPMANEKLHKDLEARSKKYGIEIASDAHLTSPSGSPSSEDEYADPVNYKYPMSDVAHAQNARVRFKQNANQYSQDSSKSKVHERIVRKELALGVEPSFDPKDALDAMLPSDLKEKLGKKKLSESTQGGSMDEKDKKIADLEKQLADLKAQMAKDSKDEGDAGDMQMAALKADNQKMCDEIKALKEKIQLTERETKFNVMLTEGKACAAQKDAFLANDMDKFISLAQPTNLKGHGNSGNGDDADLDAKIIKLADEKMKANPKLDVGAAFSEAKKELKK